MSLNIQGILETGISGYFASETAKEKAKSDQAAAQLGGDLARTKISADSKNVQFIALAAIGGLVLALMVRKGVFG